MSKLTIQNLENVAAAYDRLLAPALFQQWVDRVADAAQVARGQRVLDVACGTGVLARAAAERTGAGGSVAGVDINPGMLAVARRIAPEIDWQEAPAEALPYADRAFDAVVSQFGLMFFPAREAGLQEMMRVLKPGGHLAVAVFDALDKIPAYAVMADVFERVIGKDIGDILRFPFSLGDTEALASLFVSAGIVDASVSTEEGTARFSSVREMVLADVEGWFPLAGLEPDARRVDAVVAEAEAALGPFRTADGGVEFGVSAHLVTATRPD